MDAVTVNAVVLFGASGDLCYRKIYPALYQLGPPRPAERAGDRRSRARAGKPRSSRRACARA